MALGLAHGLQPLGRTSANEGKPSRPAEQGELQLSRVNWRGLGTAGVGSCFLGATQMAVHRTTVMKLVWSLAENGHNKKKNLSLSLSLYIYI